MRFRPCIDLHQGRVKQIVGSTLEAGSALVTNFETARSPVFYADMYWQDELTGGHVIMLGPGSESAAVEAVGLHPGFLQLGGGIDAANASTWLERGAARVIVTSYVFEDDELSFQKLREMVDCVGREHLVLDLSCRLRDGEYVVVANRWQTFTSLTVTKQSLDCLAAFCSEFLVHAVDVEGKQCGVDAQLIAILAEHSPLPTTYAGGIHSQEDIDILSRAGGGVLDFTVGSALDIFGGTGLAYRDLVHLQTSHAESLPVNGE